MATTKRMAKLIASSKKHWGDGATHVEGGVTFYQVGRNASHEFYVGQLGRFFLTYSVGEGAGGVGWGDDPHEYIRPELDEHVSVYQSFDDMVEKAYLGHY